MIRDIFILHHTHVDFGYTADRAEVCDALVGMVEETLDLIAASKGRPEGERFKWIHEVSWPVIEYLRRGGARRDELFAALRAGDIELGALYCHPTDLFDRDTLAHTTDLACDLARREGFPLQTAMFSDAPGIPWSVVDVLVERGVRYLSAAPDAIMSLPLEVERPFRWEGPGGGRVLVWQSDWRLVWYAEGYMGLKLDGDPAEATRLLTAYVARLEAEGYRWEGLALHAAMDNVPPKPQLMDFVRQFNARKTDVRVRLATNAEFFGYMESRHGDSFAVHRGAWPDWWASGNASAAFEVACSRRAKDALRRARALAAFTGRPLDPAAVAAATEDIVMFDEHTWGHSGSVSAPWSLPARKSWTEKRLFALSGLQRAMSLEQAALAPLRAPAGAWNVINPSDRPFAGLVVRAGAAETPDLKDDASGEIVPGQATADGLAHAMTLPARTTRTFVPCGAVPRESAPATFDTPFYTLHLDRQRGVVTGLLDKELKRDLLDPAAPYPFGELVHERVAGGSREKIFDLSFGLTDSACKRPRPQFVRRAGHGRPASCECVAGPVFDAIKTSGTLPGVEFSREIRLFHTLRRIDVVLHLDKQGVTDYESLYVAFPFRMPRPGVWIENAGAVYRAGVEQLPGSATDWLSVGEFAAVGNAEGTVVLAPHDAPLLQLGAIRTGCWSPRLRVPNGRLYSWIMNNLWYTNFPACQEGRVMLAWSVTSHANAFDPAHAAAFAHDSRVGVCGDVGV